MVYIMTSFIILLESLNQEDHLNVCDDGTLVQILGSWILSIILSLFKNRPVYFPNPTFRRLDSVSVFR
jgi:hypothetical protein